MLLQKQKQVNSIVLLLVPTSLKQQIPHFCISMPFIDLYARFSRQVMFENTQKITEIQELANQVQLRRVFRECRLLTHPIWILCSWKIASRRSPCPILSRTDQAVCPTGECATYCFKEWVTSLYLGINSNMTTKPCSTCSTG